MKSVLSSCLFFAGCLLILSCGPKVEKSKILGKWQGVSIKYPNESWTYKGGTQLADKAYYEFKEDDTFSGTSLTGKPQAGKYSSLGNMLYLHPTGGGKIAYELKSVSENELVFNTNPGAIGVLLKMVRK